MMFQK